MILSRRLIAEAVAAFGVGLFITAALVAWTLAKSLFAGTPETG